MKVFKKVKDALRKGFQKPSNTNISNDTNSEINQPLLNSDQITSTTPIPKFTFTYHETQEWLANFMVKEMARNEDFARKLVSRHFLGSGYVLYGLTREDWVTTFPHKQYGIQIYQWIKINVLDSEVGFHAAEIPLSMWPEVLDADFSAARIQRLKFDAEKNVRLPPTFIEDLKLNLHAYFLFLFATSLSLYLAHHTFAGFSKLWYLMYLAAGIYYGLVRLAGIAQFERETRKEVVSA